ncbi:MAG: efflux RND transporter periplasmic adaptor subunit [Thermodesulfobacteriota bacterium]|nr:MAG: efflux RND transporter periplasmic adaptor subunit [Thermodesulfobacteriota bacterium]
MSGTFKKLFFSMVLFPMVLLLLFSAPPVYAQEKKPKGPPPAIVVVSGVSEGMISPDAEFIGTVYYKEVAEVASEVSGKVLTVNFEEGDWVKSGAVLLKIDSAVLAKEIKSRRAARGEVLSGLERARNDLKRAAELHEEELLSDKDYDGYRFTVKGLEKKALSLEADAERLEIELIKKSVRAPFNGVVLKRYVDRGEWLSPGSPVATIAYHEVVDVVVNVPQDAIPFVERGSHVTVTSGKSSFKGKVLAIIPSGDIGTRTFPVKVRIKNNGDLKEGMEAQVRLPVGDRVKALLVNRDALVPVFGQVVVYVVIDSKAVMMPVEVVGYSGMKAGVRARGMKAGMSVVIKGNERLKNGQNVVITGNRKQR